MPTGSMKKFFQDQGGPDSPHGDHLVWPGTQEGFPLRGSPPGMTTQEEYENVPLAMDFHSQRFCLWDQDEKQQFDQVMDRIVNGWYMQHRRVDRWSDSHCGMVVWLEWVQIYGETPYGKVRDPRHADSHQASPPGESFRALFTDAGQNGKHAGGNGHAG